MQRAAKTFILAAKKTSRARVTQLYRAARNDITKNVLQPIEKMDLSPTLIIGGGIIGFGTGLAITHDDPGCVYYAALGGLGVGCLAGLAYPAAAAILPFCGIAYAYKHCVACRRRRYSSYC